jgi:hypothetical protein
MLRKAHTSWLYDEEKALTSKVNSPGDQRGVARNMRKHVCASWQDVGSNVTEANVVALTPDHSQQYHNSLQVRVCSTGQSLQLNDLALDYD